METNKVNRLYHLPCFSLQTISNITIQFWIRANFHFRMAFSTKKCNNWTQNAHILWHWIHQKSKQKKVLANFKSLIGSNNLQSDWLCQIWSINSKFKKYWSYCSDSFLLPLGGYPKHVTCAGKVKKLTEQCHIDDKYPCNYYPSDEDRNFIISTNLNNRRSYIDVCNDNR